MSLAEILDTFGERAEIAEWAWGDAAMAVPGLVERIEQRVSFAGGLSSNPGDYLGALRAELGVPRED